MFIQNRNAKKSRFLCNKKNSIPYRLILVFVLRESSAIRLRFDKFYAVQIVCVYFELMPCIYKFTADEKKDIQFFYDRTSHTNCFRFSFGFHLKFELIFQLSSHRQSLWESSGMKEEKNTEYEMVSRYTVEIQSHSHWIKTLVWIRAHTPNLSTAFFFLSFFQFVLIFNSN